MASITRPALVPVSAHGSAKERNCVSASSMRLTMANRSKVLRARRSMRSPSPRHRGARASIWIITLRRKERTGSSSQNPQAAPPGARLPRPPFRLVNADVKVINPHFDCRRFRTACAPRAVGSSGKLQAQAWLPPANSHIPRPWLLSEKRWMASSGRDAAFENQTLTIAPKSAGEPECHRLRAAF
jgi:hypothetical protein